MNHQQSVICDLCGSSRPHRPEQLEPLLGSRSLDAWAVGLHIWHFDVVNVVECCGRKSRTERCRTIILA